MDLWQRLGGWAQLTRISNLPTVWSNALLGRAVAIVAIGQAYPEQVALDRPWPVLGYLLNHGFPLFIAVSFFYLAGMILNDLCDLPVDRHDQPRRPLPSGRVNVKAAWLAVVTLLLLGLGALSLHADPWRPLAFGMALVGAIVLYDWLHKRSVHAVWFMGACRALVYLLGAATLGVAEPAVFWQTVFPVILPLAVVIALYTVMITYIARLEHTSYLDARRWLGVVMIVVALVPMAWLWPAPEDWFLVGVAGVALGAWLVWALWQVLSDPPATGAAVSAWLAGFCLLDAYYLSLIGFAPGAVVAAVCFGLTLVLQRFVRAT